MHKVPSAKHGTDKSDETTSSEVSTRYPGPLSPRSPVENPLNVRSRITINSLTNIDFVSFDDELSTSAPPPKQSEAPTRKINPNLAKEYPSNILIAKNNPINRKLLVYSLNKLGYSNTNIAVAFDGLEAVQLYKDSLTKPLEDRFNAILTGVCMPNMDGYEAVSKIKYIARSAGEMPVAIVVNADLMYEFVRAKAAGMDGCLVRPWNVLDVEEMIIKHFPQGVGAH